VIVGIEAGEIRAFSREIDSAVEEGVRVAGREIRKILRRWTGEAVGALGNENSEYG
jgi:hydrogenase maturation protease